MRWATGWRRSRSAATASFDVLQPGQAARRSRSRWCARRKARRPPKSSIGGRSPFAGAKVAELSPRLAQRLGLRTRHQGRRDRRYRPQFAGRRLRLPAARHRARGQWRGDRHRRRQLQAGRRAGYALVALHGRARRPADPPGAALLTDGRSVRRPIDRNEPPPAGRPLADRLRPQTLAGGRRPGASDRRGRRADAHDPLRLARLDDLLGAARHRQDDGGAAARRRDGPRLRADFGDLFRRRRPEEGVRDGAAAPHQRPPDAAVRRRDPSLQPRPAGFLPAGHGGRHRHPGRRHDGEPVLRAQRRACCRGRACWCSIRSARTASRKLLDARRRGRGQAAAARRRGEGGADAHGRWRRPRRADACRGGLARGASRARSSTPTALQRDRPAPRAGLRQGPGRPLQSDLGAAQIGARLRPGRRALLSRAHVRRRRGSALSRPPAGAHGGRRISGLPIRRRWSSPMPPRTPTTISARRRANWPSRRPASISPPRRNRTRVYTAFKAATRPPRSTARCCRPSTSSTRRPS